jgi:phosphatidylserine/phosphatidylglycerophosphate/cardiolipin synthase-like enzyme
MDFTRPLRSAAVGLVAGRGHYETVVEAVRDARASVWIATANLKELLVEGRGRARRARYRSILYDLDHLARQGVEVRILHAALPSRAFRDRFDQLPDLVGGGIELRMCPRVHMKVVIVDASLLYVGSANWTGAGLGAKGSGRRNFELGVVTSDDGWLDEVQEMYEHLWRGRECATCRVRDMCELPLEVLGDDRPAGDDGHVRGDGHLRIRVSARVRSG